MKKAYYLIPCMIFAQYTHPMVRAAQQVAQRAKSKSTARLIYQLRTKRHHHCHPSPALQQYHQRLAQQKNREQLRAQERHDRVRTSQHAVQKNGSKGPLPQKKPSSRLAWYEYPTYYH